MPEDVEAVWGVLNCKDNSNQKFKKSMCFIAQGSKHKMDIIDHIIETINYARSKFGNDVHFLLGGDFNRYKF